MKKLRLLLLLIPILFITLIVRASVVDPVWLSFTTYTEITAWTKVWVKIIANKNCTLTKVSLNSDYSTTATVAYLYDDAYTTILEQSNIVNYAASFNYALSSGTNYRILLDKWWALYNLSTVEWEVYPITWTNISFLAASIAWTDDNVWIYWVESIETDWTTPTQNPNNMFHFFN